MTDVAGADLPWRDLASSFVRSALGLGSNAVRMLGAEAQQVARRVGQRIALLAVYTALLTAGFACLTAGAVLFVQLVTDAPLWVACAGVGLLLTALAATGLHSALKRLADPDVTFVRTRSELAKDVDALSRAVGDNR